MNKKTIFYVVRHGQAVFNLKRVIGGTLEPNILTTKGEEQAKILAEKFNNIKFDEIYSSDLSRAKKTAEIIASTKNLPIQTSELLRERSWGSLQGKTFKDAQNEYARAFKKERTVDGEEALDFTFVRDMESLRSATSRFNKFITNIVQAKQGKTILVISHFDIMIGYLVGLGFGTYQNLMNADFDHAGYYKLVANENTFNVEKIVGLNIKKAS